MTEDKKQGAPDGTPAPVDAAAELATLRAELQKVAKQRDDAKAAVKEFEPLAKRAKELEDAQKSEAQKLQDQIKALEPFKAQAEEAERTFGVLLEAEIQAIPEALRGVIPDGTTAQKLAWLQKAKAGGLFGQPQNTGTGSPAQKRPSGNGGNVVCPRSVWPAWRSSSGTGCWASSWPGAGSGPSG
jgi:hypothetical protein